MFIQKQHIKGSRLVVKALVLVLAVILTGLSFMVAAAVKPANTPKITAVAVVKKSVPVQIAIAGQDAATTTPATSTISTALATKVISDDKAATVIKAAPAAVKKTAVPVKASAAKKTASTAKAKTPALTTVKWSADGKIALGGIGAFDYSYSIRNAVIRKVEAYARAHGIKLITAKVLNTMSISQ